ncbi:WS/DGAT/MGAT family O-acyltransferase [Solimonas terrae]|uniref:diacylglycerol O-acyltransferase n=1 Tax=Solimonas terrae TaxID=1396819 RepID=A0A6M2BNZ5_9GAMM|nr:wax ester/triacylglycerol synthase family O-acyltransferase [Solimonas terrae]NGY04050.1 wax ester/triacylglycerol synthase family O-acyltransferase [Solimonas terrae]
MSKLSLVDDAFLRLESRRQPLHIGMLMLFEPPADAPPDFAARLAERLGKSVQAVPPFNQRLAQRRGLHYWQEDDDFDLAHHFVHMSLPKPGRIRELLAVVSRVHSVHLDRAYPLWRMYLIEGLEDGRIAVYLKIHHSVVDGVAGIRMLMKSMSNDRAVSAEMPPPWEVGAASNKMQAMPIPVPAVEGFSALKLMAREGVNAAMPVIRRVRQTLREFRNGDPDIALAGEAPRSLLNSKLSATRRFAAQQYSTPRMRAVGKAAGATLNDVVLAMCGGALRRYLLSLGQLPDKPLIAGVPISIRRDDTAFGNEVAFTIAHLATNVEDPLERLQAIKRCMDKNKERLQAFSPAQVMAYAATMLMPGALNMLFGRSQHNALGSVVVSHVPGPREDIYWQGARLTGLYPASLLFDTLALNITVISRHDYVDFGLIACRKSVPQMQRLLDYLEDELAALEARVGIVASRAVTSAVPATPATSSGKPPAAPANKRPATRRKPVSRKEPA